MEIWEAKLVLCTDENDNWKTFFKFEKAKGRYSKQKSVYYEQNGGQFIANTVPVEKVISRHYSSYKVSQGFEHELSEQELIKIESDMKDFLVSKIMYDKDEYLNEFFKKIICLGVKEFTL